MNEGSQRDARGQPPRLMCAQGMLEQAKAQEVGDSFRPCAPRRAGTAHAHRMRLPARPLDQLHPTGPGQGQSGGLVRLRPRHRQQRHTSTRRRHNYGWRCVRAQRSFTGGLTPGGPLAPLPPGPRAQLRRSHPAPLNTTCIRKRSPISTTLALRSATDTTHHSLIVTGSETRPRQS